MEEVYKGQIVNLEEKLHLKEEEGKIKDKMLALKDQELVMKDKAFKDMTDVADRAIKLAETKKSSIWEMYGPIAVIAIIIVTIASVL